jgi:RNA ligase
VEEETMTTAATRPVMLGDLLDETELAHAIGEGYIRRQVHPEMPLAILNYTERCQYERAWTDVTRTCRGLIVRDGTGEVLARPWAKFFNYGEHPEGSLDLSAPAEVTDKMDGSLGILYRAGNEWAIATRGSFASDQARWATAWFQRYANPDFFDPRNTYLFEVIAHWNRIVVQYDWEGLVLLGIVETETGRDLDLPEDSRLLQARHSRDDGGEYKGQCQRVEDLPGVPVGSAEAGLTGQPGAQAGVPEGLEGAEQGARQRAQEGQIREDQGSHRRGEAREALPGLRADVSALRDGLRSRTRSEEVQRGASQESKPASARDREMRAGVRQLPQGQDFQPFRIVTRFSAATLADALALPLRPNVEGVVVKLTNTGLRLKIKQADYVALHRLITGMNARVVWERIGEGETAEQICSAIPEEFWPWVREVGGELVREKNRVIDEATAEHERITASLPEGWTRKDYALIAAKSEHRAWLFNLLDERDPSAGIWRTLKPSGERTLVAYSEDTA